MAVTLRRDILDNPTGEALADQEAQGLYYDDALAKVQGYYSEDGRRSLLAIAYMRLAEVYRYSRSDNRKYTRSNYERAINIFTEIGQHRYLSEALQGLGNIYLDESTESFERGELVHSVQILDESYNKLYDSVSICRQYGLQDQIPKLLHRMAHFFSVFSRFENKLTNPSRGRYKKLLAKVLTFVLPEEEKWLLDNSLRGDNEFMTLDILGKAQRLFEVSVLESERLDDVQGGMDSLVEACATAAERGRPDDVYAYEALARNYPLIYQQPQFSALLDIALAELDISEGNVERAFDRVGRSFPDLARGQSYRRYLIRDYLRRLIRRLRDRLGRDQAIAWCDQLIALWIRVGLDEDHPESMAQLYYYRNSM